MNKTKPSLKPLLLQLTILVLFYQVVSSGFEGMHNNIWNRYGKPFTIFSEGVKGDIRENLLESTNLEYSYKIHPEGIIFNIAFWIPIIFTLSLLIRWIFKKLRGQHSERIQLSNIVLYGLMFINFAVILRSREVAPLNNLTDLNLPASNWFNGWPHGFWIGKSDPEPSIEYFVGSIGVNVLLIGLASFLLSAGNHIAFRLRKRNQNQRVDPTVKTPV